ncbi:MAG TPA: DUF1828 domain-containing protein [Blastocatellia bacterium]|nr:DUF1828 domain-containing protein [Blastocatellia bacterium]
MKAVQHFSLVRECDQIRSGALRISTPFHYPDGSLIDVFLEPAGNLFDGYKLSDGGQTADYVADLKFDLFATKKRRLLISDICETLDVKCADGSFEIHLTLEELHTELPQAIVRLSQACIRAADLIYTQRLQIPGSFQDEVEEFLSVKDLDYEPDYQVKGDYGKIVKVDFKVTGQRIDSFIQTLSSRANAHASANEKISRWIELLSFKNSHQLLTVVDQHSGGFQQADLEKLGIFSTVLSFPEEQEELYEALAA